MINFYQRFLPNVAKLLQPLHAATCGKSKVLEWNDAMAKGFQSVKSALTRVTMLLHPWRNVPISLTVDASEQTVGAASSYALQKCFRLRVISTLPGNTTYQALPGRPSLHCIY